MTEEKKKVKARKVFVEGRVQGVGYRYFTLQHARRLGIKGYVRNLPDGKVEVVYIKPKEITKEIAFLKKLKEGPFLAKVHKIDIEDIELNKEFEDFEIRY